MVAFLLVTMRSVMRGINSFVIKKRRQSKVKAAYDIIAVERRYDDLRLTQEYSRSMRDGFGRGWPAGAERLDAIAEELLRRGVTHVPNIFGDIEIKANWQEFQAGQRAVIATRGR